MAAHRAKDWKGNILIQLQGRNKKQTQAYVGLIQAHNKLVEITSSLKSRNVQLQVEAEKLKEENLNLQVKVETGGGSGGGGEKTAHLEQKLYKLQEELTELHRKRGENAQQIIDLKNVLQEKEKDSQLKDAKLSDSEANILALKSAQRQLENTIIELEATNQMLKDEHQALQLAFTALEEKYRKVMEENCELVQRWMDLKAKDADKLNEENDDFLKKRQAQLRKDLADAAKEPVSITETGGKMMLPGITPICLSASIPSKAQCVFMCHFSLYMIKSGPDKPVIDSMRYTYDKDAHEGEVNAVQWSGTGRLFATGSADRKIKLWEIVNGKCEQKGILTGSNAGIMAIEFDIEDSLILGASNDFASRVWSVSDQRLRHTLTGHSGKVLAAKFLSDTNKVVSGSHDRTLKVWDLHSKACIKTIFAGSSCNDLVTLHGNNIISGHFDKRVRFWDTRSDSSANEIMLQGRLTSLDLAPDRCSLLCCTRDDSVKIIDLRMNQVSATFCADGFKVGCDWSRAVFSPDGSFAAAGSSDGGLYIWNVGKNKVEKLLKEHSHAIMACTWNPIGSSLVSCERSRKVIYWADY